MLEILFRNETIEFQCIIYLLANITAWAQIDNMENIPFNFFLNQILGVTVIDKETAGFVMLKVKKCTHGGGWGGGLVH